MRVFYCDHYELPLPPEHRFPMGKYALLRGELAASLGPASGSGFVELEPAPLADRVAIERVHDPRYVQAFMEGQLEREAVRRIGFPWSEQLVLRTRASVGGTLAATEAALDSGMSGTLAGGTHHAHYDYGAGFCVFNDIAIAARQALLEKRIARALVFDVDVHQGDGTAALFATEQRVFTCSLHGAKNFPGRKQSSDLDVAFPDATTDEPYLEALATTWHQAFERARPDIVFYQGGVDPLDLDRLGRLAITAAGLEARDQFVLEAARAHGVPIVLTLGGGYADPIEHSINAHLGTYRAAATVRS